MRLTSKEWEEVFNAVSLVDEMTEEDRTDRTPDEAKALHSAFLKLRLKLRGF